MNAYTNPRSKQLLNSLKAPDINSFRTRGKMSLLMHALVHPRIGRIPTAPAIGVKEGHVEKSMRVPQGPGNAAGVAAQLKASCEPAGAREPAGGLPRNRSCRRAARAAQGGRSEAAREARSDRRQRRQQAPRPLRPPGTCSPAPKTRRRGARRPQRAPQPRRRDLPPGSIRRQAPAGRNDGRTRAGPGEASSPAGGARS